MNVEPRTSDPLRRLRRPPIQDINFRRGFALLAAGVPAYALSLALMAGSLSLFTSGSFSPSGVVEFWAALLLFAPYGLPFTWIVVVPLGGALWRVAAQRGPVTMYRAAKYGVAAALIIVAVETLAVRVFDISRSATDHFWLKHAFDGACTLAIGAITGCVALLVAGERKGAQS